jgi:hypothetical protein
MVPARAVRTAASLSARLFICFPMAFIGGRPLTSSGVMARTPCAHRSLLVIVPAIARAVRSVSNIGWLQRKKKCRPHDVQDPGLITQERSFVPMRLEGMSSVAEIARPLARAINIYCSVAGCGIDLCTRRYLARHIRGLAEQGVDDPGRLTVHGLSYLRNAPIMLARPGQIRVRGRAPATAPTLKRTAWCTHPEAGPTSAKAQLDPKLILLVRIGKPARRPRPSPR